MVAIFPITHFELLRLKPCHKLKNPVSLTKTLDKIQKPSKWKILEEIENRDNSIFPLYWGHPVCKINII